MVTRRCSVGDCSMFLPIREHTRHETVNLRNTDPVSARSGDITAGLLDRRQHMVHMQGSRSRDPTGSPKPRPPALPRAPTVSTAQGRSSRLSARVNVYVHSYTRRRPPAELGPPARRSSSSPAIPLGQRGSVGRRVRPTPPRRRWRTPGPQRAADGPIRAPRAADGAAPVGKVKD